MVHIRNPESIKQQTSANLRYHHGNKRTQESIEFSVRLFAEKNISENSVTDVDGMMTVVIENGKVYAQNSVCPSGVCEHSLPITKSGDSIICLPNKIMIKISGEGETDAISG